jgi:hypothetical protein
VSWTTISIRKEIRERIEAFMKEKGFVSPSDVIAFLFEHYDSRIRLEEKVRELEDRLSLVEKYMEDLLFTKAPQAQSQQPSQLPEPTEPKLIPASELPEAKKALEEAERAKAESGVKIEVREGEVKEERRIKPKTKKTGVYKVLTVEWIKEKTGKDPEEFMREWEEMGCSANYLPGKTHVAIASDDVIEEAIRRANELKVKGNEGVEKLKDEELKKMLRALNLAGFIYYDGTREEWRRA